MTGHTYGMYDVLRNESHSVNDIKPALCTLEMLHGGDDDTSREPNHADSKACLTYDMQILTFVGLKRACILET
jgi:hypothetical protein